MYAIRSYYDLDANVKRNLDFMEGELKDSLWFCGGELSAAVITSYSIHYTKLYEKWCLSYRAPGPVINPYTIRRRVQSCLANTATGNTLFFPDLIARRNNNMRKVYLRILPA